MNKVNVNDLIGIGAGSNTHGCSDYLIARVIAIGDGEVTAEVTECESCQSCWQVGHDYDHVFATVGDTLTFDIAALQLADDDSDFVTDVKWIA